MKPSKIFSNAFVVSGVILAVLFSTSCSVSQIGPAATPAPHAFISYDPPAAGETGIRLAVKDLIDMKGHVTTAGSYYFQKHGKPAVRDADCLRIARARGVTIVGKTNLTEFAVGVSGINDHFGTAQNPAMNHRMPGGSSSGSAAAVGLGLADVAFGTDTGGSIRVPAASCGVAGLKTTKGLVSIRGVYPISPDHLDTVGPLARDVAGLVTGMGLLQDGFENLYEQAKTQHPTADSIRIGRLYVHGTDPAIDRAVDRALETAGFQVHRLGDEFGEAWKQADHDGGIVAASGAWLTNKDLRHHLTVSHRAKDAITLGEVEVATGAYKRAVGRKAQWQATLNSTFQKVHAIALPVLKKTPLKITFLETPEIFEERVLLIQNTVAVNFAGNPAVAIPIPLKGAGFPVTSLQLIGPNRSEAQILNIGRLVEAK